jgi:hypothetical protein
LQYSPPGSFLLWLNAARNGSTVVGAKPPPGGFVVSGDLSTAVIRCYTLERKLVHFLLEKDHPAAAQRDTTNSMLTL